MKNRNARQQKLSKWNAGQLSELESTFNYFVCLCCMIMIIAFFIRI